jgi:carboxymethylenebutenolidase
MATITIPATDGSGDFAAYVGQPAPSSAPRGVVVLIQEVFGVNQAMRDIADWVADLGFIAVCPDLFWRIEPNVDITDKSEAEWKKAFELFGKFDQAKGIEDLKATVTTARGLTGANGKVATMGYCLGGRLAFMMAEQSDADVNISYYGVGLDGLMGDIGKVTKPLLVHIADRDEFFPEAGRKAVVEGAQANRQVVCYNYDADHAFARVNGIHWHGLSAAMANGRSAEALAKALG